MCGKKDNFGAPGTPGCSHAAVHVAFTNLLRMLGFVSFSTYFPIRNQLQLVTLWNGPHTLSIGCVWMASWVDSPQVCGDGAGAALLRGARCGQASITWWTQCYHDLRRPGSAVRMFMRPFVWAECAQHIHVNVLPGCFQISRANPEATASEERVRPRNTLAPFVRVRCAAKRTILAHRERRAVHMPTCAAHSTKSPVAIGCEWENRWRN